MELSINIHGKEYPIDFETYNKLLMFERDVHLFFVKAKNRKEKKYFEKKTIHRFDVWFVMSKEDLDSFYSKI